MTELQLEFIRKFGRKDLSFGCKCTTPDIDGDQLCTFLNWDEGLVRHDTYGTIYKANPKKISDTSKWITILGHPVQFHDVFARLKETLGVDDIVSLHCGILQIPEN